VLREGKIQALANQIQIDLYNFVYSMPTAHALLCLPFSSVVGGVAIVLSSHSVPMLILLVVSTNSII
jgi:hypothetical protein